MIAVAKQLAPNNDAADNGPALSYYAQHSLPVPPGVYYVSSTIETGNSVGGKLVGAGRTCEEAPESRYVGQPVTILVWNGNPTGTLLHIQRQGFTVEDIALQGMSWQKDWQAVGTCSLVDIEQIPNGDAWNRPCGNITFNRVSLLIAKYGVRVLKGDHGDGLCFRDCVSGLCMTVFQSLEPQSVGCLWDHLTIKDDFDYAFDMRAGGRFEARNVDISGQCKGAILSLGDNQAKTGPDANSNCYNISNLWFDNVMRNVCIVQEQTPDHPCIVNIGGYMCSQVTVAKPPVAQLHPGSRIKVEIDQCGTGCKWLTVAPEATK